MKNSDTPTPNQLDKTLVPYKDDPSNNENLDDFLKVNSINSDMNMQDVNNSYSYEPDASF